MQAAVASLSTAGLEIVERDIREPKAGQVQIRFEACDQCHPQPHRHADVAVPDLLDNVESLISAGDFFQSTAGAQFLFTGQPTEGVAP